jgi:hypothetical protein
LVFDVGGAKSAGKPTRNCHGRSSPSLRRKDAGASRGIEQGSRLQSIFPRGEREMVIHTIPLKDESLLSAGQEIGEHGHSGDVRFSVYIDLYSLADFDTGRQVYPGKFATK